MRSDDAVDLVGTSLNHAIDVVSTAPLGASLFAGFTGVAWATEIIGHILDAPEEDENELIDQALSDLLHGARSEQAPFDLMFGVTGLGVYALERWPRAGAVHCAALVVDHLAARARLDEHGAYWWTSPSLLAGRKRERHPTGGVDLGVAHGIAGVIAFLARARALGIGGSNADSILEAAVAWLLAHAVDTESGPTIPGFVGEGDEPGPARSAWCYGDPGVAAALLIAGREARQPAWREVATELALRAAERPPAAARVADAGFCHGSAGLAHVFNRMHQMTGESRLAEAALFWLEQTLDWCETAWDVRAPGVVAGAVQRPWNGLGVVQGAAGVGLVLLAASTPVEPVWDRMFLVSPLGPEERPTIAAP
jgi:hypothetical protein